jgi:hypothetical protein
MEELDTLAPAPDTSPQPESAPKEAPTLDRALDNAFDKVFDDEPEMLSTRARDERGRFAQKEAEAKAEAPKETATQPVKQDAPKADEQKTEAKPFNPDEPPSRLSAEAKAAWLAAPPALKADVHRTISEMEQGIAKYRETATRWETDVRPYEQLAQQYGMDIKGVLADYEGMARMMATDPVRVFDTLATRHGFTLQELAANVLQQDLDEYAQQTSAEIKRLQAENNQLKQATQQFTQGQQREIQSFIAEFAVKNPRYDELEGTIAGVLRSGLVTATDPRQRLQEAYNVADRLKPGASVPAPQNPALAAQNRKGQLSVTGAPGSGSDPARRKPPTSALKAIDDAFDALGI